MCSSLHSVIDGHHMTLKISKNITNCTKELKSLIHKYNELSKSCLPAEQSQTPAQISWNMVGDVTSSLWATPTMSGPVDIPADVRQQATKLYYTRQRAQEEIQLLEGEMKRIVNTYHRRIEKLLQSLPLTPADEQSVVQLGTGACILHRIYELHHKVCHLYELFRPHITDLPVLSQSTLLRLTEDEQTRDTATPLVIGSDEAQEVEVSQDVQEEIEYWDSVANLDIEEAKTLQHSSDDIDSCMDSDSDSGW